MARFAVFLLLFLAVTIPSMVTLFAGQHKASKKEAFEEVNAPLTRKVEWN